jgi:hypothetical protein
LLAQKKLLGALPVGMYEDGAMPFPAAFPKSFSYQDIFEL